MASRAAFSWYTPEVRITRAVMEQTDRVAINTSKMPHMPCSTGSFTSASQWTITEVPSPASLEKTPIETPVRSARAMP